MSIAFFKMVISNCHKWEKTLTMKLGKRAELTNLCDLIPITFLSAEKKNTGGKFTKMVIVSLLDCRIMRNFFFT